MKYNKNANVTRKLSPARLGVALGLSAMGLSAMVVAPGLAAATQDHSTAAADYRLSYNGSDLNSVESVKALHLRIRRVALDYCPKYGVVKNLNERASCIKDVESDLVSQVDHPLLTKVHSGAVVLSIADTRR